MTILADADRLATICLEVAGNSNYRSFQNQRMGGQGWTKEAPERGIYRGFVALQPRPPLIRTVLKLPLVQTIGGETSVAKAFITLKPSEQAILGAAATIYAGYVSAGRVPEGEEKAWLRRSLQEALGLARLTDDSVQADGEFD